MNNRSRLAALAVLLTSWLVSGLAAAPAALALHREDGDEPGPQISTLKALLIFGVIPVGIVAVIALLVSLPSIAGGPRYRPGLDWDSNPEWYGAPGAEADAEPGAYAGPAVGGATGARGEALTGRIVTTGEPGEAADGGSSASW